MLVAPVVRLTVGREGERGRGREAERERGRGREGGVGSSGLGDECSTDSVLTVAKADGPSHLVQVSHSEFLQAMDTHVVLDRAECPMVSECSPNVNIYMYSVSECMPNSEYTESV